MTQINVEAHLDNDGRLHVVETHQVTLGKGAESEFRVFGRSVDQQINLHKVTRIDADGTEHPLVDPVNQEVTEPDQFRYYPRGHVYFRYPAITEETRLSYRFEYELLNAVNPAWGLGAGWKPLTPEFQLSTPAERFHEMVADAQEAQPDPQRRYRLDHGVLFPERGPSAIEAFEINYRLVFDDAWREVDPQAELAHVTPGKDYRVRRLFEYLPPGEPPAAAIRPASTRFAAVGAVVGIGVLLYLAMVVFELVLRGINRLDPDTIAARFAQMTPEEVAAQMGHTSSVSLESVLNRMANEGKIAIDRLDGERDHERDDDRQEVHLRLLTPRESLPKFEQELVNDLFADGGDIATSDGVRRQSQVTGHYPDFQMRQRLGEAQPTRSRASWLALPAVGLALWAIFRQVQYLADLEATPFIVIASGMGLMMALGWPKRWWGTGRSSIWLLIPLLLLATAFGAAQLLVNRPFAAEVWTGSAVCILSLHLLQLVNSRIPTHGLERVKAYAQNELKTPTPQLDDRWMPHLLALGLGPEIGRWQDEHGVAVDTDADSAYAPASFAGDNAPFTGRMPHTVERPLGWAEVFFDDPADDDLDEDDDDDPDAD